MLPDLITLGMCLWATVDQICWRRLLDGRTLSQEDPLEERPEPPVAGLLRLVTGGFLLHPQTSLYELIATWTQILADIRVALCSRGLMITWVLISTTTPCLLRPVVDTRYPTVLLAQPIGLPLRGMVRTLISPLKSTTRLMSSILPLIGLTPMSSG